MSQRDANCMSRGKQKQKSKRTKAKEVHQKKKKSYWGMGGREKAREWYWNQGVQKKSADAKAEVEYADVVFAAAVSF